jgi:hypothetical protein
MPKLKRASSGHWYTKTFVHAAGRIATWQIADEGVERIRSLGYKGEEFPVWLFAELRESGLAFTKGSGFDDQAPLDTLPAKDAEKQLNLAISETDQGWVLGVLVPELPAELFAHLIRKVNQSLLRKCFLEIDHEKELLRISELWPGKGGKSWPVDPHEHSYPITLKGPWPPEANLKFLTVGVDGLDGQGSLFFASDKLGARVPRGTVLVADSFYYLVADAKHGRSLLPPPAVAARVIGENNHWKAWEIRLPVGADETVRRWCAQLGAGIEEPKLVLDMVTPPPKRMLITGVPLLEVGDEIVVSATPTSEHVRLDQFSLSIFHDGSREQDISELRRRTSDERLYLKYTARRPGTYQIRAVKGRVAPITFAVQPRSAGAKAEELLSIPAALSVKIGESSFHAFRADLGEARIDIWVRRSEETPRIAILYPGLLRVEWSVGGTNERRFATSSEAMELLTRELAAALAAKKAMAIEVDAGSFGRLEFRIAPEVLKGATEHWGELPATVLQRARWLAATVESLRARGTAEGQIDAACRVSLGRLGSFRGCTSLKNMASAPLTVIQQAKALGRLVSRSAPPATDHTRAGERRT